MKRTAPTTSKSAHLGRSWLIMQDRIMPAPGPRLMPTTRPGVRPEWFWNLRPISRRESDRRLAKLARRQSVGLSGL